MNLIQRQAAADATVFPRRDELEEVMYQGVRQDAAGGNYRDSTFGPVPYERTLDHVVHHYTPGDFKHCRDWFEVVDAKTGARITTF